ncbi:MAG TPA: type II toxin-antitoxin system PemK/MazF family toxin [Candidatus Paceibacterota bacterium]|jgi:mRNA interferase MazF|nr:type II toxin-antitoxin system PemK/MazF family toxin [Candidatus Paceibacterota bacterium]
MKEEFLRWCNQKIHTDAFKKRYSFKEREVWWVALGRNIGSEQNGKGADFKRPVLIFKKFNQDIFWAIPLSSKIKEENRFYRTINVQDGPQESAIISQLRLLDAKRLISKMGIISKDDYSEIQKAVMKLCSS